MIKTVLVLPCLRQSDILKFHLGLLSKMPNKPDHVVVVHDYSDDTSLESSEDGWVQVVRGSECGRSSTRNKGIREALGLGADVVVFMDGDSIAEDDLFFSRLSTYFDDPSKPTLIFGTRVHVERPYDFYKWLRGDNVFYERYKNKPSDLLTANMDNLRDGLPLDHRDLREVADVVRGFESLSDFNDKVDYMLTGMVSWSCNFAITRSALELVQGFMKKVYCLDGMHFDEVAFREQWGYEDIAFGVDALYAGVDVHIQDQSRVIHFMHGRSDNLFAHVHGKHLIMERYRHILLNLGDKPVSDVSSISLGDIDINPRTIIIKGRSFERKGGLSGQVYISESGIIRIGDFIYDYEFGTFKKSKRSSILSKITKVLALVGI